MLKRLLHHALRVKTLILIFALSWWMTERGIPALGMAVPMAGEEAGRWYILFAVLFKMSVATILFHVIRHELFPYLRLGAVIEDYRAALGKERADLAQAAAIQALAHCVLIGWLLSTIVSVVAKW